MFHILSITTGWAIYTEVAVVQLQLPQEWKTLQATPANNLSAQHPAAWNEPATLAYTQSGE